jgi:lysozyme
MAVPAAAVALVKRFEGFARVVTLKPVPMVVPYLCPARVWTIGYGTTHYSDGRAVGPNDRPITEPEALGLMLESLHRDVAACYRICPVLIDEPEHRLAAITSFVDNLGPGRLQASTLRRRIAERDWHEAAYELRRWVWAGGQKLPGLIARREAEAALLLLDDGAQVRLVA